MDWKKMLVDVVVDAEESSFWVTDVSGKGGATDCGMGWPR